MFQVSHQERDKHAASDSAEQRKGDRETKLVAPPKPASESRAKNQRPDGFLCTLNSNWCA